METSKSYIQEQKHKSSIPYYPRAQPSSEAMQPKTSPTPQRLLAISVRLLREPDPTTVVKDDKI